MRLALVYNIVHRDVGQHFRASLDIPASDNIEYANVKDITHFLYLIPVYCGVHAANPKLQVLHDGSDITGMLHLESSKFSTSGESDQHLLN